MMASAGSAAPLAILRGESAGIKSRERSRSVMSGLRGYGCGPGMGEAGSFTGYFILHTLRSYGSVGPEGKELEQTSRAIIHYRKLG